MIWWWTDLPSSSAIKLAHAFGTPTNVTEFGCTPCCCIHQYSSSAFCPCPYFTCPNIMVLQVTTSRDGILLNTLQASSRLPHFAYMSTKLLPYKDIWLQTTLKDLVMYICALFKCNHTGTFIQHPHEKQPSLIENPPVAFVKIVPGPSSLACISHVPILWRCSKWPHFEMASCWTLWPCISLLLSDSGTEIFLTNAIGKCGARHGYFCWVVDCIEV